MSRKVVVTMRADIALEATEEEEKVIEALENSTSDDEYDELREKLDELVCGRIIKEMKKIEDVDFLDINWD